MQHRVEPIRLAERTSPSGLRHTRHCDVCGTPTSGRKPYCPKHVMHSQYAQEVQAKIDEINKERRGSATPRKLSQEIVWYLKTSGRAATLKRIAKDLGIEKKVVNRASRILEEDGVVQRYRVPGRNIVGIKLVA